MPKVDVLILCYAFGIAVGNVISLSGLRGEDSAVYKAVDETTSVTVALALALPLLLFSTDLSLLRGPALCCMISTLLGAFAIVFSRTVFVLLCCDRVGHRDNADAAGVLTAILVGPSGTPNGAATRTAMDIDDDLYIATHTSEVVVGAVYVLLVITVAKRWLHHAGFRVYDAQAADARLVCLARRPTFPVLSPTTRHLQTEMQRFERSIPPAPEEVEAAAGLEEGPDDDGAGSRGPLDSKGLSCASEAVVPAPGSLPLVDQPLADAPGAVDQASLAVDADAARVHKLLDVFSRANHPQVLRACGWDALVVRVAAGVGG